MSNDKNFPSDKADKYVVRFPDGMRDKIAEAAKANSRSMNAEIVARLEASFLGGSSEEMELLKEKLEHRDQLISILNDHIAQARAFSKSQESIIAMLGAQIRMLAEGYPDNGNTLSKSMRSSLASIGNALAHNDFEAALIPMQAMLDLAIEKGYLNKDGTPGPKYPEIKKTRN